MQDVAVEIVRKTEVNDKVSICVNFWNIHGNKHFGTKPYLIDENVRFELTKNKFDEFVAYELKKWYPRLYKNQKELKEDE
jgi:hypothetical protein